MATWSEVTDAVTRLLKAATSNPRTRYPIDRALSSLKEMRDPWGFRHGRARPDPENEPERERREIIRNCMDYAISVVESIDTASTPEPPSLYEDVIVLTKGIRNDLATVIENIAYRIRDIGE